MLLLSRGPARIAAYPSYRAPRPRTGATLPEPDFVALKSHCLEIFQREVRAKPQP
jgi:NitT/TauT family transport system ATP-binding protein